MSSNCIYYVYAYIRKSDGTPYYIGKGKGERAFKKHTISVPKDKSKIIFLEKNLTEIGAFALERRMIRWWGRKDIGTGILRNGTDGGDGGSGRIFRHTEESKRKLSSAALGRPGNKNQKLITSQKLIGTSRYCYPDGTYYGRIKKDDPAIQMLGLVIQKTESMSESNKKNAKKATSALTGSKRYNNGIKEISAKEHPGEGWVIGRLPRTAEYVENHKKKCSATRKDTFVVNDGIKNIYIKNGMPIPEGYVIGMAPRNVSK